MKEFPVNSWKHVRNMTKKLTKDSFVENMAVKVAV